MVLKSVKGSILINASFISSKEEKKIIDIFIQNCFSI